MFYKSILKVVGVVAVVVALCVGCGGDNGVSGGGNSALYGSWVRDMSNITYTFNSDGTGKTSNSSTGIASARFTYSANGGTLTLQLTHTCDEEGCRTKGQWIDACNRSNDEVYKKTCIRTVENLFLQVAGATCYGGRSTSYSINGNTMTWGILTYTKK